MEAKEFIRPNGQTRVEVSTVGALCVGPACVHKPDTIDAVLEAVCYIKGLPLLGWREVTAEWPPVGWRGPVLDSVGRPQLLTRSADCAPFRWMDDNHAIWSTPTHALDLPSASTAYPATKDAADGN